MMENNSATILERTLNRIGSKGETIWLFDYQKKTLQEVATDDNTLTPERVIESYKNYKLFIKNGGVVRFIPIMREVPKVEWTPGIPLLVRLIGESRKKTILFLN